MISFDNDTGENTITHNPNWLCTPDHQYKILIIGSSELRKTCIS